MARFIEIVNYETGEVVKRIDVSGRSDRAVDKIDRGIQHNLNHDSYFTREAADDTEDSAQKMSDKS